MGPLQLAVDSKKLEQRCRLTSTGYRYGCRSRSRCRLRYSVDSKTSEHGCRLIYAGVPSFLGLGLTDGPVPSFRLLL